jgi:hypothetical protein
LINDFIYSDDIPLKFGDFIVAESEQAHIEDIIVSNKGEYRQYPLLGVGALNFLNGNTGLDEVRRRISTQLKYDNFVIKSISLLKSGELRVIARQNEKV